MVRIVSDVKKRTVSSENGTTNVLTLTGALRKRGSVWKQYVRHRYLLLFLLPALVYVFVRFYIPMYGVTIAFKQYSFSKGILESPWVGFANFARLLGGATSFWRVLRNTLVISGLKLTFIFSGGIALALLLNELRNRHFKKVVQSISYMPHFLSWVIIGGILREVLSPSRGIVNQVIQFFGAQPVYFLTDKSWFIFILISSDLWQSIGWGSIVYLAAISSIDPGLYESAYMDGAGRFRMMRSITLPSIMNVVVIMFLLAVGNILSAGFDQIFNLYNPLVYEVSDILDTFTYRIGLEQGNFSMSTAVSLFKNVVGLILVIAANKFANRFGHTGLW